MLKFWPQPNIGRGNYSRNDISTRLDCFNADAQLGSECIADHSFIQQPQQRDRKIDHNFNQNNIVTGRYFFGDSTQSFPLALTASGGQLPGFNTITPTRVQLVSLS